jgi:Tripartite tricarboxylate transporter family receptor
MPAAIVDKLDKEINAGLADPKMKARLANLGATALALSPAEFGKPMAVETEKWGKVIKFAGIKARDPAKYSAKPVRQISQSEVRFGSMPLRKSAMRRAMPQFAFCRSIVDRSCGGSDETALTTDA